MRWQEGWVRVAVSGHLSRGRSTSLPRVNRQISRLTGCFSLSLSLFLAIYLFFFLSLWIGTGSRSTTNGTGRCFSTRFYFRPRKDGSPIEKSSFMDLRFEDSRKKLFRFFKRLFIFHGLIILLICIFEHTFLFFQLVS